MRLSSSCSSQLLGRVEAGRGLVEQQQRRVGGERTGNLDQPLMAVGEARDQLVGAAAQSDEVERGHRALGQSASSPFADQRIAGPLGADHDILQRRHRAEQANVLECAAEASAVR